MQVKVNFQSAIRPGMTAGDIERLVARFVDVFLIELTGLFNAVLIPKFQRITPIRTGHLRWAIRVSRQGTTKLIIGFPPSADYWIYQRGLAAKYNAIYRREIPALADMANRRAREMVGIPLDI